MENAKPKFKILSFIVLLCAFSFNLLAFPAPACAFAGEPESPTGPNSVSAPFAGDLNPQIRRICTAICKGEFAAARKLLGESDCNSTEIAEISKLRDIVSEYETIDKRRRSARKAAYAEKLAELDRLRVAADTNDVNDVNDVNDITSILSVIAQAFEFADEKEKAELLSQTFLKEVFQKARAVASEFEAQGQWLKAYTSCYWWLKTIDPNNQADADYAEQLLEKANIVLSFQDSPCETRSERYNGVKKEMFVRAVDALKSYYVNRIDYRQMAIKACRRCRLLAEVVKSSSTVRDALSDTQYDMDNSQYTAFSAAMAAVLDEVNQTPTGISMDKFTDIFENVLALNSATVELPEQTLIAHFAEAALAELDPYTVMIWPKQIQDFRKLMTNEFTGIGIEISKPKGLLTVASLLPDTPAYNSGLDAGDVIEAVDAVPTSDMSLNCVVKRITGPPGTQVRLTIRRPGEEQTRDVTITRANIVVPTIRGWQRTAPSVPDTVQEQGPKAGKRLYMIDEANKIGYVRITSFSAETASDLEKVLTRLEAQGLKGLILDLRFNTGGLLDIAAEVVDKFVEQGLIVSTRPRFWMSSPTYLPAHRGNTHPNYPLVILINSSSASASEIVAGALADKVHNRATLVGERTHGKGSVQGISDRPGGGAKLKYTMAHYHLPSNQRVESRDEMKKQGRSDWGIGPDITIKLRNDEIRKMSEVQRDNDVLVKIGHDNSNVPLSKHTVEETLDSDAQLAVAVLVMKSKLIQESL